MLRHYYSQQRWKTWVWFWSQAVQWLSRNCWKCSGKITVDRNWNSSKTLSKSRIKLGIRNSSCLQIHFQLFRQRCHTSESFNYACLGFSSFLRYCWCSILWFLLDFRKRNQCACSFLSLCSWLSCSQCHCHYPQLGNEKWSSHQEQWCLWEDEESESHSFW